VVKKTTGGAVAADWTERLTSAGPLTTPKTGLGAAFAWTLSDQLNAVPAKLWNHASSCG
jgi:hypothetical protein